MSNTWGTAFLGEHVGCGGRVLKTNGEVFCAECGQSSKHIWRHKGTGRTMEPAAPAAVPRPKRNLFGKVITNASPASRKRVRNGS